MFTAGFTVGHVRTAFQHVPKKNTKSAASCFDKNTLKWHAHWACEPAVTTNNMKPKPPPPHFSLPCTTGGDMHMHACMHARSSPRHKLGIAIAHLRSKSLQQLIISTQKGKSCVKQTETDALFAAAFTYSTSV